ncbi:MAG: hypothetical protein OEY64_04155 [Nitrospinota bacterium]|nr:hypothetical protein [Nitrospinota bacterium]
MKLKLAAKMSQRLIMTPAMQQAIKLLPLTRMELVETIRQELDENPFLEESTEEEIQKLEPEAGLEPSDPEAVPKDTGFEEEELVKKKEEKSSDDVDWESFLEEEAYQGGTGEGYNDRPSLENTLRNSVSLHDHLLWQLNVTIVDPHKNEIGQVIIADIDDDGFFKTDLAQIAEEIGVTVEEVAEVLEVIKNFDPTGVGAADIKESLMLQAEALEPDDPVIRDLIMKHLDHIAERNYPRIAKDLGVDIERLMEAIEFIRTLDPAPGSSFGSEKPEYVEPDLYIVKVDNEWQVYLNDDGMPRLKINNFYKDIENQREPGPGERVKRRKCRKREGVRGDQIPVRHLAHKKHRTAQADAPQGWQIPREVPGRFP